MSILEKIISVIAPPVCVGFEMEGSALCNSCQKQHQLPYIERCFWCSAVSGSCRTCLKCRAKSQVYAGYAAINYDSDIKELVKIYKFGHQRAAARPLAQLVGYNSRQFIASLPEGVLVVPVPSGLRRTVISTLPLVSSTVNKLVAKLKIA